jgi:hypothetical protein
MFDDRTIVKRIAYDFSIDRKPENFADTPTFIVEAAPAAVWQHTGRHPRTAELAVQRAVALLLHLDFHVLRLRGRSLRDVHTQYAVLRFRTDGLFVDIVRQGEAARKSSVTTLYTKVGLIFVLLDQLAVASDGNNAVQERDLDVVFLHFRQFRLDHILFARLADIRYRSPIDGLRAYALSVSGIRC